MIGSLCIMNEPFLFEPLGLPTTISGWEFVAGEKGAAVSREDGTIAPDGGGDVSCAFFGSIKASGGPTRVYLCKNGVPIAVAVNSSLGTIQQIALSIVTSVQADDVLTVAMDVEDSISPAIIYAAQFSVLTV